MLMTDSGKLLKKPIKWLYVFFAVLAFLPALAFLVYWIYDWDEVTTELSDSFWGTFVSVFMLTILFYTLVVIGLLLYWYWKNRKQNLDEVIETGSRTVAIPLFADINQCCGEANSILMALVPTATAILLYIACILTGGLDFYEDWNFLLYLLAVIGIFIVSCLLSYLNLLFTRFIAEKIRLVAQIGNDVNKLTKTSERAPAREADDANVKFAMPLFSPKEKKWACGALIFAALFALTVAVTQFLIDKAAMGRSIFKDLTEQQVSKAGDKYDHFGTFYYNVNQAAAEATDNGESLSYADITYKKLYKFINDYCVDTTYLSNVKSKADKLYDSDVRKPMQARIDSTVKAWDTYIAESDPTQYLVVEPELSYYTETGWYSSYNRPQFYFKSSMPKGQIADAVVSFHCEDADGGRSYGSVDARKSLSEITKCCDIESALHYLNIDNSTYWDTHKMVVTIESVTLTDGRVLTSNAMADVPYPVREYMDDKSERVEYSLVKMCIDEDYPSRFEYARSFLEQELMSKDQLMFNFYKSYLTDSYPAGFSE